MTTSHMSKAEAIMQWGGIDAVQKRLDAYDAMPANPYNEAQPCEYGHFDCSINCAGACHDELLCLVESQETDQN